MRACLNYKTKDVNIICVPKMYRPFFQKADKMGTLPNETNTEDAEVLSLARQFGRYIQKFNKSNDLDYVQTTRGNLVWKNQEA